MGAIALSATALAGAVTAYGYYGLDWGCAEQRLLTRDETVSAFAAGDLELRRARASFPLPAAQVYRHELRAATLVVIVCDWMCKLPTLTARELESLFDEPHRLRRGFGLPNAFVWVADSDRRAGRSLAARTGRIVDDLLPQPTDRCYVA